MVKSVQFSHSIKQDEWAKAITFNSTGTLMIAGCDEDINVWKFNQGLATNCKKLSGNNGIIQCLAFSTTDNWFASGSDDGGVCCWKEDKEWICIESERQHKSQVLGLLVYQQQIISCGRDKMIIIWKMDHQNNKLIHDYTLTNDHQKEVLGISLNSEESQLVSCSSDKQIILWVKGTNNKWTFSSSLIMQDFGYRICFLSSNMIAWQQYSKGFTHILESKDGQLITRSDLNIELSQDQFDVSILFPTIYNKKKQILIQKHNKFVYILQDKGNCQFQNVSYPIECSHQFSYGALTEEGDYLVVWNYTTKVFRFYNIVYE